MLEFLRSSVQYIAPVFVICTMLNVGLTQKPSAIAAYLKNWPFVLKMLFANFVFAPLVMVTALYFIPFDPSLKAGLLIFCLGAGAPFLIKLTQTAEHDSFVARSPRSRSSDDKLRGHDRELARDALRRVKLRQGSHDVDIRRFPR